MQLWEKKSRKKFKKLKEEFKERRKKVVQHAQRKKHVVHQKEEKKPHGSNLPKLIRKTSKRNRRKKSIKLDNRNGKKNLHYGKKI